MKGRIYLFIACVCLSVINGLAFTIESTRFHCGNDTIKINELLRESKKENLQSANEYMLFFANKMLGTPYVANTLEGEKEELTINIEEVDCTTFVENLVALTKAAQTTSPSWYTFASNLENIRYHSGKVNGYASRLHYMSAWIVENTARGNIREVTSSFPRAESQIKSLYFMTANRDRYPAMKSDSVYNEIKNMESGYNMHMLPFIGKSNLIKKDVIEQLKDGDIVCLTTKKEGLDVTHLGIIQFKNKKPYLLHASSDAKKVVVDKYDLYEMIRNNRNCTGIRVIRVTDNN